MPISGTRYRPTTPNAQRPPPNAERSTPNVSMEAVRFEMLGVGRWALGVERRHVASPLLSISSLNPDEAPASGGLRAGSVLPRSPHRCRALTLLALRRLG